jgi:hypothetical protein
MRNLMLRCPRLFWKISPRSLSFKVDGHVAEKAESKAAQPEPSAPR